MVVKIETEVIFVLRLLLKEDFNLTTKEPVVEPIVGTYADRLLGNEEHGENIDYFSVEHCKDQEAKGFVEDKVRTSRKVEHSRSLVVVAFSNHTKTYYLASFGYRWFASLRAIEDFSPDVVFS